MFIRAEINVSLNFTIEKLMTCYMPTKIQYLLFSDFNQANKRKYFYSRYFAVISLKMGSPFNSSLKDMHNTTYIQTYILEKMSTCWTPDLEVCPS